jgi:hypothetical protein
VTAAASTAGAICRAVAVDGVVAAAAVAAAVVAAVGTSHECMTATDGSRGRAGHRPRALGPGTRQRR